MVVFVIALTLLIKGSSGPMSAQQAPTQQERQFENRIAKHVPLEVKLNKEKEKNWKDLKNENWARDFELEITNRGVKPIYFFYLLTFFDVPTDFETQLIAPIHYGRPEIGNLGVRATVDDVPIKPGESKVFKINPNILVAWDKGRREKGWRLPTKVRIKLEGLSFGDGTGLMLDEGVPYPKATPETPGQNSLTSPIRGKREAPSWRPPLKRSQNGKLMNRLPAAFRPVNYFGTHSESSNALPAIPMDECEPACSPRVNFFSVRCYGCEPQNDPISDPSGPCTTVDYGSISCTIPETGESYPCTT